MSSDEDIPKYKNRLKKISIQESSKADKIKEEQKKVQKTDEEHFTSKKRRISESEDDSVSEEDESLSDDEFIVEKIIGKKFEDGELKYLVKWDGYSTDEATWEPLENLETATLAVKQYEESLKTKESQKSEANSHRTNNQTVTNMKKHKEKLKLQSTGDSTTGEAFFSPKNIKKTSEPPRDQKPSSETREMKSQQTKSFGYGARVSDLDVKSKQKQSETKPVVQKDVIPIKQKITPSGATSQTSEIKGEKKLLKEQFEGVKKVKQANTELKKSDIENYELPIFGHFFWDKPQEISRFEYDSTTNDLDVYINWCARTNGFTPEFSRISRSDVLKHDPLFLIYQYEKGLSLEGAAGINLQTLQKPDLENYDI